MLKKQIRLNRENEGRHKAEELSNPQTHFQHNSVTAAQSESEIAAAAALVDVGQIVDNSLTGDIDAVVSLPVTTSGGSRRGKRTASSAVSASIPVGAEKRRRGRKKTTEAAEVAEGRGIENPEGDIDEENDADDNSFSEAQSDSDESGNEDLGLDRAGVLAVPAITNEALEEEGQQYHLIRPLLSLGQYTHLAGTKSRPKLRCGMKDCRRHTSYYCVKCTRDLQMQSSSSKAKVFALCSPMVENNFFCFYRHSLGLGERDKATAEGLKALEAQKPKKYVFHKHRQSKKGAAAAAATMVLPDPMMMSHVLLGNSFPASIPTNTVEAMGMIRTSDDESNI